MEVIFHYTPPEKNYEKRTKALRDNSLHTRHHQAVSQKSTFFFRTKECMEDEDAEDHDDEKLCCNHCNSCDVSLIFCKFVRQVFLNDTNKLLNAKLGTKQCILVG